MTVQYKHLINSPASLVLDALQGLCAISPHLALDSLNKVVYLASPDRSKVALLCGGGAGHEPAHSGFVGNGILSAAVCGNVFASPNASQVRRGIDLVDNNKGTVIIVKNYTGDVLNFGLAKEQYAASHPEQADRVKLVVVGDDVAVGKTQGRMVGRRGLAGTVLVYKIAGALAGRGGSLDDVYHIAKWVSSRIGTIGVGLEHCHVPGTAVSESHLSPDDAEIGLGIHNESGHQRISPVPSLRELVPRLVKLITSTTDPERSFLPFRGNGKDSVVLLVNNLGGLSELEFIGVVAEVRRYMDASRITIKRILSGSFMTSLNMLGFSITLLLLPSSDEPSDPASDVILSLLDAPADAPGWKWSSGSPPRVIAPAESISVAAVAAAEGNHKLKALHPQVFTTSIERACRALIAAEAEITRMDSIVGDGDCGLTLKSGAEVVLKKVHDGSINGENVVGAVISIAQVAEQYMGGTSGALYSIFFSALAQNLQANGNSATVTHEIWAQALSSSLTKLYDYTLARPPSRTLVDPLAAFVDALSQDFTKAVKSAQNAAESTRDSDAKAGRSAYIESDRLRRDRVPDPGAWAVKVILENLLAV